MSLVSFPYPILGLGNDYTDAEFQVGFRWPECDLQPGEILEIPFSFDMNDQEIQKLIDSGKASYGFEVSCSATSRRDVFLESETQGRLTINTAEIFGEVRIAPRIFVLDDVAAFSSPNFNPEFENSKYYLAPGDFIAAAADETINIDFKKLKFESLLKVLRIDALDQWTYSCELDGEHLIISMGAKFHDFFMEARHNPDTAPFLVMSVYKDCILAALETLVREKGESASTWSNAIFHRLDEMDLKLPEEPDLDLLNGLSQKLVQDLGVARAADR